MSTPLNKEMAGAYSTQMTDLENAGVGEARIWAACGHTSHFQRLCGNLSQILQDGPGCILGPLLEMVQIAQMTEGRP